MILYNGYSFHQHTKHINRNYQHMFVHQQLHICLHHKFILIYIHSYLQLLNICLDILHQHSILQHLIIINCHLGKHHHNKSCLSSIIIIQYKQQHINCHKDILNSLVQLLIQHQHMINQLYISYHQSCISTNICFHMMFNKPYLYLSSNQHHIQQHKFYPSYMVNLLLHYMKLNIIFLIHS